MPWLVALNKDISAHVRNVGARLRERRLDLQQTRGVSQARCCDMVL